MTPGITGVLLPVGVVDVPTVVSPEKTFTVLACWQILTRGFCFVDFY